MLVTLRCCRTSTATRSHWNRLARCLLSQQREDDKPRRGLSPALLGLLLLLIAAGGWWAYGAWQDHQAEARRLALQQALVERLRTTPGIIVTDARFGPTLSLRGLRDPLAPALAPLLNGSGLAPDALRTTFAPYLDLSPSLVLERARHKLHPPEGVDLHLRGTTLVVSGVADDAWITRLRLQAPLLPGIDTVEDQQLKSSSAWLMQQVRERLSPLPKAVKLRLQGKRLEITGLAPLAWIDQATYRLQDLPLHDIRTQGLESRETRRFDILQSQIDGTAVYFEEGTRLGEEQQRQLQILAGDLRELADLGGKLARRFHLLIVGRADGVGLPAHNEELAMARARTIRQNLIEQGVPEALLQTATRIAPNARLRSAVATRRISHRYQTG